jgi:hypothetical protein
MRVFLLLLILALPAFAANTPPTPQIVSAVMRPGTTLMDVIYQVNDPDDATVRVRALAFVNGTRSFANILRPVTFVGDTAANLGDAIPTNTPKLLTWNVGADWDIDLGQVKFEILALDSRGLLGFDWITIPAANGQPALTISKDSPSDAAVLNALFWLYADNDPGLTLANGVLNGSGLSGIFAGALLAEGSSVRAYAAPFIFKKMNLDVASDPEVTYASGPARTGLLNTSNWHAANRPWGGMAVLAGWGQNSSGQLVLSNLNARKLVFGANSISAGDNNVLVATSTGEVLGWGLNDTSKTAVPAGLISVAQVVAGPTHSLALKSDGTVVGWGHNGSGQINPPADLNSVLQVATRGSNFGSSLALKSDGTVIGWGHAASSFFRPIGSTKFISARNNRFTAINTDNTLHNLTPVASRVTQLSDGTNFTLGLTESGTVVGWGDNSSGQISIPAGLTNVVSVDAGESFGLALKADGTVVAWGSNVAGETSIPAGLSGVTAISAGSNFAIALKAKAP